MTEQHGGDTVSDEEWARAMGEAPEDNTADENHSRPGKSSDRNGHKKRTGKAEGAGSYDVGYGKPPKHTQFTPGHSGHRGGRPKKKKIRYFSTDQFHEDLISSLEQEVPVIRGSKKTKVPIIIAIYDQLALKAAKGDYRSAKLVIDLLKLAVEQRENSLVSLISEIFEIDREFSEDAAANPDHAEEILRKQAAFRGSKEVVDAFSRVNRVMPKRGKLTPAEARLENTTDLPWDLNKLTPD